jgi:two-component system, NarL family, sensor histidine kinase UhpB
LERPLLKLWNRLSLRARLLMPLATMFVTALLLGGIAVQIFSPGQFTYENEQASRSVKVVADALNAALQASANPQQTLDAFAASLGATEAIQFRAVGAPPHQPSVRGPAGRVPNWFITFLELPEIGAAYPVRIGSQHVGDVVFAPDISPDIFEKWVGFLAIVSSAAVLMVLTGAIAYLTVGTALRPLEQLGEGLTRMREGNYDTSVAVAGPPEIRQSCAEANQLASTLKRLSVDNRDLIRKIVSLQDDERRDLARELHDELGPLLFAIRANATALFESVPDGHAELSASAGGVLEAVESVQQANRRILEGLSPLYVGELGLKQSIETLLRNVQSQAPHLALTSNIDPRLNDIDGLLSQTTYRVIQESLTNVLRHAQATSLDADVTIGDEQLAIEISDDGIGFPSDATFGRGLTGMYERVRALNGTFELLREDGRTLVRCRLPIEREADALRKSSV